MVKFRKSNDRDHRIDLNNAPDSLIPDNFDDYLARVAIHGTAGGVQKNGKVHHPHDVEANLSQEEYIQMAANVVTAPGEVIRFYQDRGWVRYYAGEYNGMYCAAIVPEKIIPDVHDPTFFVIRDGKPDIKYMQERLNCKWYEDPQIIYDSSGKLHYSDKTLNEWNDRKLEASSDRNTVKNVATAESLDSSRSTQPTQPLTSPNSTNKAIPSEQIATQENTTPTPDSIEADTNGDQFEQSDISVSSTATAKDPPAPAISLQSDAPPSAESTSAPSVQTEHVDTTSNDVTNSHNTSTSTSSEAVESSSVSSIEAVKMDTPSTDELSAASEDSLEAGDQPGAVDFSPAEQAESVGDVVDADGVSDLEIGAPSAEEDESPSALDVVAYEAIESGEISLDGVLSEDDVGAEDVASEEDNGELGPDFLSGDESSVADQAAAAESIDGAQDTLADAEMDDGDDVGVESEAGVDGELGAESDASDVLSSDLSLESSEETAEADDSSLDVDEQATVEDVAALEDAASVEDESDIDLDAVLSVEPAMEDQSGAVDSEYDEVDFVSEAEIAELEESLSDNDAALDDATDLQGEFLAADDTDVYDVDESPLVVTDAPADEDVLSDGTADAGDELEFVSEAEIAELEASLSDSDTALDDDFLSPDEHDDMAVQDSPSTLDDTTDLQGDVLSPDDTSSVDDDFLSMDDLAVDEEDFSDSAVDASDEIGFDEPSDVGLDADNDDLDIDTNATDIDANDDIDADDDDDVSESGGFSL
ncbi:hypothetical protein [Actinomyces oris]|uniref:hypothetical protein n=1 Tax=Actinomyces oris TaxID=544580 RepID=UPI000A79CE37|nr:hypothetical protein [Actinomyces oris]